MKPLLAYTFLLICCLCTACGRHNSQSSREATEGAGTGRIVSDSACSVSLVKDVLKWYARRYNSIDSLQLVNIPSSEDSGWNTVNFDEAARYMRILRSSGYFTEKTIFLRLYLLTGVVRQVLSKELLSFFILG